MELEDPLVRQVAHPIHQADDLYAKGVVADGLSKIWRLLPDQALHLSPVLICVPCLFFSRCTHVLEFLSQKDFSICFQF